MSRPLAVNEDVIWKGDRWAVMSIADDHALLLHRKHGGIYRAEFADVRRAPSRDFIDRMSRGLVRAAEDIPEGYEIVETLDGRAARGLPVQVEDNA